MSSALAIALTVAALVVGVAVLMLIRTRHRVTTPTERAVHSTLHTASLAAVSLRVGLTEESARDALGHLRVLTAADAVALYDD
ncbi:MAG: sensor histidine kinase, partial [Gordonia amarae]